MSLQAFTREIGTPINKAGGGFMLHPETGAAGSEIGLDFLGYYALGRGGVLGNVCGDIVASAFFVFEPGMVSATWDAARAKVDPLEAADHYAKQCAAWGRARIADVAGLDDYAKNAERVVEAADIRGLSLFAGWRNMPLPDDAAGRAYQLTHVLREFRGGANGIATRSLGISPQEAVAVNSPGMFQIFGWQGDMPDPEAKRDLVAKAEDITDDIVGPAFSVLSASEQEAFTATVHAIQAAAV